MSEATEAAKAVTKENKEPKQRPKGPPMLAVPPALMKQTLDLLQAELPMAKCRDVVLSLERCQIINVQPQAVGDDGD